MFSIGKTDPRLYKRTLASAGTSCVVVTKTFTQLLLRNTDRPYRVKPGEKLDEWIDKSADWGLYDIKRHLELMMDRDLSAWVSQESVRASTSALSCSQLSLLAGPSRPKTKLDFTKHLQHLSAQLSFNTHVNTAVNSLYCSTNIRRKLIHFCI